MDYLVSLAIGAALLLVVVSWSKSNRGDHAKEGAIKLTASLLDPEGHITPQSTALAKRLIEPADMSPRRSIGGHIAAPTPYGLVAEALTLYGQECMDTNRESLACLALGAFAGIIRKHPLSSRATAMDHELVALAMETLALLAERQEQMDESKAGVPWVSEAIMAR